MKKAAIYCRVSTEDQEREGTSLQTQLEACLNYCQEKGYEVAYRYSEAYSGLALERPRLNELREHIRAGEIDVLMVYCLDRLSRDPTNGVILTEEMEKSGVILEAVTETVESTDLGKLISYIRGFASKLEAAKIKERTMRGRIARVRQGRMAGSFHVTYGYDYVPVSQKNGGRRAINEVEAEWVKKMFDWLVNDGLTTGAITNRLRAAGAPTKKGKYWNKRTVLSILSNVCYAGKTFAFTTRYGASRRRPREEWIEIPGATPAIISEEMYEAAQRQLQVNREKASRNNTRHQYLLRGHIRCRQCGHAYSGGAELKKPKSGTYWRRYYRCPGRKRHYSPIACENKGWGADKLEASVWEGLQGYLDDRERILKETEKLNQDAGQLSIYEAELMQIERHLKALSQEQKQLLQWALKGFPEETVVSENKRINQSRNTLLAQKADAEARLKTSQKAIVSVPKLEKYLDHMRSQSSECDFENKRTVLEMLDITVWIDREYVEVTGTFDPEKDGIAITPPLLFNSPSQAYHQYLHQRRRLRGGSRG